MADTTTTFDLHAHIDCTNTVSLQQTRLEALLQFIIEQLRKQDGRFHNMERDQRATEERVGEVMSAVQRATALVGNPEAYATDGDADAMSPAFAQLATRRAQGKVLADGVEELRAECERLERGQQELRDALDALRPQSNQRQKTQATDNEPSDEVLQAQIQKHLDLENRVRSLSDRVSDDYNDLNQSLRDIHKRLNGPQGQQQSAGPGSQEAGELVWYADGNAERLGVIDGNGVLRDLGKALDLNSSGLGASTVTVDMVDALAASTALSSLPAVEGDRKVVAVRFADGVAESKGKVFHEGREWPVGGVRFGSMVGGNGKVLKGADEKWIGGTGVVFASDTNEGSHKKYANERFQRGNYDDDEDDDAEAAELVWYADGNAERLGVIDASGVLRDLGSALSLNNSSGSNATSQLTVSMVNELAASTALSSLPAVEGDRKVVGVRFADGVAEGKGRVFKEGREWSKDSKDVRFGEIGSSGSGKTIKEGNERWVGGTDVVFAVGTSNPSSKKFGNKEKFQRPIAASPEPTESGELVWYGDGDGERLGVLDGNGVLKDLGGALGANLNNTGSNNSGSGIPNSHSTPLTASAVEALAASTTLSSLPNVKGVRKIVGVQLEQAAMIIKDRIQSQGQAYPFPPEARSPKAAPSATVGPPAGTSDNGESKLTRKETWVGGVAVAFPSGNKNQTQKPRGKAGSPSAGAGRGGPRRPIGVQLSTPNTGVQLGGSGSPTGAGNAGRVGVNGAKLTGVQQDPRARSGTDNIAAQLEQINNALAGQRLDIDLLQQAVQRLQNAEGKDDDQKRLTSTVHDMVLALQDRVGPMHDEYTALKAKVDTLTDRVREVDGDDGTKNQGAKLTEGNSGSSMKPQAPAKGHAVVSPSPRRTPNSGGGSSGMNRPGSPGLHPESTLVEVINVVNLHDAAMRDLIALADKNASQKDVQGLTQRVDVLEQCKADADVVAHKAENAYVDMAVDNVRKDLLRSINASSGSIMDTLDKSLNILRDMLDGKAEALDLQRIKTSIQEQSALQDGTTADGLAGYRCLSCNKTMDGMRVRPQGMVWPNFTPHTASGSMQRRNYSMVKGKKETAPELAQRLMMQSAPSGQNAQTKALEGIPSPGSMSARLPPLPSIPEAASELDQYDASRPATSR